MIIWLLLLVMLGILAWAISKLVGWALSVSVFVLGFLIVAYLVLPVPLEPYLGWVRDIISAVFSSLLGIWNYFIALLR